jgi:hypothetical protein
MNIADINSELRAKSFLVKCDMGGALELNWNIPDKYNQSKAFRCTQRDGMGLQEALMDMKDDEEVLIVFLKNQKAPDLEKTEEVKDAINAYRKYLQEGKL